MRPLGVTRKGAIALGAVRGAVAAGVIFAVAYVLSWQILYAGPVGNDILYHLHLTQWVDTTFPNLGWWYAWDDHGIAYREGYPLAAHWVAVAISRLGSIDVASGMQVVEFATNPLGALGLYVFCAWRLHRPLAGLVAGVAYLLSPFTWTFLVDWGFFSNQAGTVLFMPSLIALDVFFDEWKAGRRGWKYRLAAVFVMGLVALMGLVSPFLLGAAVAAIVLYAAAIRGGGLGKRMRWLLVVAPLLLVGTFLLTAFWSLPQQQYFSYIATRVPPRAFDPNLFQVFGLDQILGLHPLRPNVIFDRMALSPAVWLPAVAGVVCAAWNPKARALVSLVGFGLLTMTTTALASLTWGLPVLPNLVHARAGVTLVQFLVPVLAGLGVTEAPAKLAVWLAAILRAGGRGRLVGATTLIGVALALELVGVARYANWVDGNPNALAYGDFAPNVDVNDLWAHYAPGTAPRTDLASQLLDPARWRAPQVGCLIGSCSTGSGLTPYRSLFSAPPQRAVVDAHVPLLLMDFRDLTGGSQAYTYNFQLPASPELDNWMLDSMLNHQGTTAKAELSYLLGIDAVVLGSTQVGEGSDYQALGWQQVSSSPLTFVNPSPSGLATEWPSGSAVLVVGSDQRSGSHPYNDLFERATTGMIPFTSGWLARGQSAYVDDYTAEQLARYPALILLGYRYHDQSRAWGLLDDYVRNGGSLYVETGWQYVDPDWNVGSPAPSILPVGELRWSALDPTAPVLVSGSAASGWGSMASSSAGAGWGASSAGSGSLRAGAESLVSVGGRVVVARTKIGRGRVVWSGMNLIAHDAGAGSATEDRFVADLFAWLLGGPTPQIDRAPSWLDGDQAQIDLAATQGPTWVLFKESFAPGWSAELGWPSSPGVAAGSRAVPITDGELDMMMVRLGAVPPGAQLVFTYGPTASVYSAWLLSAVSLLGLGLWVVRPRWFSQLGSAVGRAWHAGRVRLASVFRWREEED